METLYDKGYIGRGDLTGIRPTEYDVQVRVPLGFEGTTPQHTGSLNVIDAANQGVQEAQSVLGQYGDDPHEAANELLEYVDRVER